jgi:ribosomal protein S18 acetylase RimI-like enzyme
MVPGLHVRPAVASDLEDVTPLAGSRLRAEARLRAAAAGDDSMLVAVLSGDVAGAVSIRWTGGCDPPHPWLYGLHVAPRIRRRGAGRALMTAAEDIARQRGAGRMSLDVDVGDTRALAFYEVLGYAVVRRHEHHWRSVDPRTGAVLDEGTAPTLILRTALRHR